MINGKILKIADPVAVVEGLGEAAVGDAVLLGEARLCGEVLSVCGDCATVALCEGGEGLCRGDNAEALDEPFSLTLGPGLLGNLYDACQRPLTADAADAHPAALDEKRRWYFEPACDFGDEIRAGDLLGYVQETPAIRHRITAPANVSGTVAEVHAGTFTVKDTVLRLRNAEGEMERLTLAQKWPIRTPRPYAERLTPTEQISLGLTDLEDAYPLAKGGVACLLGACGTGKTALVSEALEKAEADIVVLVACGERPHEIAAIRNLLESAADKNGRPLRERTVVLASAADTPVGAQESLLYSGMTVAEYYRDMGYSVLLLIDSISRFADALRALSAARGEVGCALGYPAYLGSRLAQLLARAGVTACVGRDRPVGALTALAVLRARPVGAADPVADATLRASTTVWGLGERARCSRSSLATEEVTE